MRVAPSHDLGIRGAQMASVITSYGVSYYRMCNIAAALALVILYNAAQESTLELPSLLSRDDMTKQRRSSIKHQLSEPCPTSIQGQSRWHEAYLKVKRDP
jgi:hypothetical protein